MENYPLSFSNLLPSVYLRSFAPHRPRLRAVVPELTLQIILPLLPVLLFLQKHLLLPLPFQQQQLKLSFRFR